MTPRAPLAAALRDEMQRRVDIFADRLARATGAARHAEIGRAVTSLTRWLSISNALDGWRHLPPVDLRGALALALDLVDPLIQPETAREWDIALRHCAATVEQAHAAAHAQDWADHATLRWLALREVERRLAQTAAHWRPLCPDAAADAGAQEKEERKAA